MKKSKILKSELITRQQVDQLHKIFQDNPELDKIKLISVNNGTGIGPNLIASYSAEVDITDTSTW